ncbi:hypothetical protein CDL15_Pgr013928 [Punica granatum]|uniref:BED-type domain-containing protein n=1 Tax=Punica granatum TaxID=22663 RepID=A0A218W9D0_PUNGR|nr:hypothetical protein CDL15_Pgr013928 [Punica granatum]
MTANKHSADIKYHGTIIDKKKMRVRCSYCSKSVSGTSRLKQHLGGVRGDVTPCPDVPANVKVLFQDLIFHRVRRSINKEVLSLDPQEEELPLKRSCSQRSNNFKHSRCENISPKYTFSIRREESFSTSDDGEIEEDIPSEQARKIGRFFYQNLIDVDAVNSASFREMMYSTVGNSRPDYKIPSSRELKGRILQAELTEMQDYVQRIKQSWSGTGCSILLDTWTDEQGWDLVNILVDCPQGQIYLKSSNVSSFILDLDALQSMLNKVVEEVGAENVVQIVACTTKGWLGDVGKQFMNKGRTLFWTISASHCIELMLEEIGLMGSVKPVLDKATSLTKFMLQLVKREKFALDYFRVPRSDGNSVTTAFMTLGNIVAEKEKLEAMITSPEWDASVWASMEERKRVADLVKDPSFWDGSMMVVKASGPLVRVLSLIRRADTPLTGYIYETMDQVKEAIKKEFKNKESQFIPFWEVIDEIWDGHLHSPLHAAGYYLNPSLFYSSNFNSDTEVAFGLLCCIVCLIQDHKTQDLLTLQLDKYRQAEGAFGEGSSIKCRKRPPCKGMNMLYLILEKKGNLLFFWEKR